jgi:hypothetical protein
MALTGHALKGRPDTGSAGWIKRDLYDGGNRMGKTISLYHLSIESAPDAIIPPRTKKALWHQWADPAINRSVRRADREGHPLRRGKCQSRVPDVPHGKRPDRGHRHLRLGGNSNCFAHGKATP